MPATIAALSLVLLATPFTDAGQRFAVDLPAGWEVATPPPDAHGAVFRRSGDGVLIHAAVRVMPLGGPVSLATFVSRIAAAADQEPGYRLLERGSVPLAGVPAARRRYVVFVNGERKLSKIVEQRLLVVGGSGYVLHAETLADAYPAAAPTFAHFFASFRLGGGAGAAPALAAPLAAGAAPDAGLAGLAGTWEGGGHKLVLTAGGEARLDGIDGTFRTDHGVLILGLTSDQRIFRYHLAGDRLRLEGSTFGDGQLLRRGR